MEYVFQSECVFQIGLFFIIKSSFFENFDRAKCNARQLPWFFISKPDPRCCSLFIVFIHHCLHQQHEEVCAERYTNDFADSDSYFLSIWYFIHRGKIIRRSYKERGKVNTIYLMWFTLVTPQIWSSSSFIVTKNKYLPSMLWLLV